jgi:hypothetical protein
MTPGWDIPLWCINRQHSERKPQGYFQKTYFIDQDVHHVSVSLQSPVSFCNFLRSLLFWDVTQRILVVSYRRFGSTCPKYCLKDCLDLEDGTERLFGNVGEKSTLRNIPEERRPHLHRGGSPKGCLFCVQSACFLLYFLACAWWRLYSV